MSGALDVAAAPTMSRAAPTQFVAGPALLEIYMVRWQVESAAGAQHTGKHLHDPRPGRGSLSPSSHTGDGEHGLQQAPNAIIPFKSAASQQDLGQLRHDLLHNRSTFNRDITLLGQTVHLRSPPVFTSGTTVTAPPRSPTPPAQNTPPRRSSIDIKTLMSPSGTTSASDGLHVGASQVARGKMVNGTATSTGPTSTLRISEAVPVLTGQGTDELR
ncbi:MAG: hypothetical protein R2693_07905 [Nocardioidaceae bacterium]